MSKLYYVITISHLILYVIFINRIKCPTRYRTMELLQWNYLNLYLKNIF